MPSSTRPGDLLADRYRLDDLLSESGSGRFWRAHDRVLRRDVALHVMAADDDRVHLLLDAARRSATVSDARVLRVLDAEQRDDICFVVNEWGYGTSLDIALANNGPLAPRRAAWVVAEVADSLQVAHARGVVHGRLAPENVLIDESGAVRIIGLCVDAALHGLPPGSPGHDLADLGGLLHAALTGRWAGASPSAVTAAPQSQGRVLRPRQVRAGVPRVLDELVDELVNGPGDGPIDRPAERNVDRSAGGHAGTSDSSDNPETPAAGTGRLDSGAVLEVLVDFVGDPTGIARSLASANPLPPTDVVVLPPVPDIVLRVAPPPLPLEQEPAPTRAETTPAEADPAPGTPTPDTFGGRPLFAPLVDDDGARRARAERIERAEHPGGWSLDTDATGLTRPVPREGPPPEPVVSRVPGRRWLRLAWLVALLALLFVAFSILTDDTGTPQPTDQVVPGSLASFLRPLLGPLLGSLTGSMTGSGTGSTGPLG